MSFRRQPKRFLTLGLPAALEARIRRESGGVGRRSLGEVASEALCLGFGIDPGEFGIRPGLSPPSPPPAAAAARRKVAV